MSKEKTMKDWENVSKYNVCPACNDYKYKCRFNSKYIACRSPFCKDDNAKSRYCSGLKNFKLCFNDGRIEPNDHKPRKNNNTKIIKLQSNEKAQFYRSLMTKLDISEQHVTQLINRGLSRSEINLRQYKTWPNHAKRQLLAKEMASVYGEDFCLKIAGFYKKSKKLNIAGREGILLSVRNEIMDIANLKVRLDQPIEMDGKISKYLWISSNEDLGGVSSGSSIHVPCVGDLNCHSMDFLGITEGELKADIATVLSKKLFISIPGVASWRSALPYVKKFNPKKVAIAFDADFRIKPAVFKCLVNLFRTLCEVHENVNMMIWDQSYKGIDDLLCNGLGPYTLNKTESLSLFKKIEKNIMGGSL